MRNYSNYLLDPSETTVLIIDEQPQMFFGVESHPRSEIMNNVVGLAKACQAFGVPCILTTVEASTFSGYMYSKLQNVCPDIVPIDRTAINAWEDTNVRNAVDNLARKNLVIAGLWTEACATFPALCATGDGYNVFVATDACGGATKEAHDMAVMRMVQAGVKPVTWQQVMLEWQRDWANKETYNQVMAIVKEHSGAYGLGVEYSETMTLPAPSN
ncbi:MAG: hydrolase [Oscillospiraceae bacterium]|jgi:nicotinamidase-related amidase|nr:hydrolase [Oscillospiraceae bacterium]